MIREADLLIYGPPRSGTTLTCGILSNPPHQYVFNEVHPKRASKCATRQGFKQVLPRAAQETIEWCHPTKLICIVRDLRYCAISYKDRLSDTKLSRDELALWGRWQRVLKSAHYLPKLYDGWDPAFRMLVRYEDLVSSPMVRQSLADFVGWELHDENCGLVIRGDRRTGGRVREADHWGTRIDASSEEKRRTELETGEYDDLCEMIENKCGDFQRRFGFG